MFPALPYYSHSSAKSIYSCFLYTTQGDAEHAELQESDIQMILRGCYIAGMRLHRKKQFSSPNLFLCIFGTWSIFVIIYLSERPRILFYINTLCHYAMS